MGPQVTASIIGGSFSLLVAVVPVISGRLRPSRVSRSRRGLTESIEQYARFKGANPMVSATQIALERRVSSYLAEVTALETLKEHPAYRPGQTTALMIVFLIAGVVTTYPAANPRPSLAWTVISIIFTAIGFFAEILAVLESSCRDFTVQVFEYIARTPQGQEQLRSRGSELVSKIKATSRFYTFQPDLLRAYRRHNSSRMQPLGSPEPYSDHVLQLICTYLTDRMSRVTRDRRLRELMDQCGIPIKNKCSTFGKAAYINHIPRKVRRQTARQ